MNCILLSVTGGGGLKCQTFFEGFPFLGLKYFLIIGSSYWEKSEA